MPKPRKYKSSGPASSSAHAEAAESDTALPGFFSSASRVFKGHPLWPGACLVLAALLTYSPALRCGYIWDDDRFVTENPLIHAPDGLRRFWFTREAPDYFPLTSTLLWIEWRLWGGASTHGPRADSSPPPSPNLLADSARSADPITPPSHRGAFGFHLVNILLHAGCGILLWRILRRLAIPGAWLAGLFFILHPVNVESVAWITERKNTLSMTLYLGALLLYLRFEDKGGSGRYALAVLLFLLALLSKTSVVMLPGVLLGAAAWRRGRITRADVMRSLPFFACALALGLLTVFFQYTVNIATDVVREDGLASRVAIAGKAVWFYLSKALLPGGLMFVYPRWPTQQTALVDFVPGLLVLAAAAVFWWQRRGWGRPFLFGFGYYVVSLLPVLGFLDIYFMRYSLVADHWQYVALPGVIALATGLGVEAARRAGPRGLRAGAVAAAMLAVVFIVQCHRLERMYRDEETLWRTVLRDNPRAFIAHNNLGTMLERRGRYAEARDHFHQAVEVAPNYKEALTNLGNVYYMLDRDEEAAQWFRRAIAADERYVRAHINLGNTLARRGLHREALEHYERAIALEPRRPDVYFNLAATLLELDEPERAAEACEKALALEPGSVEALNNLAAALARRGNLDEAERHFRRALGIQPDNPVCLFNVGYVLQLRGEYAEAVEYYEQALRRNPALEPARQSREEALQALQKNTDNSDK